MAGDWIKMRADLHTHPKVVRIASALKADRLRVVGALHAVWCLFDAHSEDGRLNGYTADALDDLIGWAGFAASMEMVQWLQVDPNNSLKLPDFEAHNGQSAKRRAQEADRKKSVRKASASDADKKRTREEKRREENTDPNGSVGGKASPPPCPHKTIIDLYHELVPTGTGVKSWTAKRSKHLHARWKESPERQSLDWWRSFFVYVSESEFLTGRAAPQPGRDPFVVSLDWLVDSEKFTNVLEGKYHRRAA